MLFAIYGFIVEISKHQGGAGMIVKGSRESVIQNLEDAGCGIEMIRDFMGWFDKGQQAKQLELLEHQREYLLGRVHRDERRISYLDYLVYQIQGQSMGKR